MNDFTKEELEEILWAVDYVRERTTNRSDAMRRLQGNILSMIDNYCEHDYQEDIHHIDKEGDLEDRGLLQTL